MLQKGKKNNVLNDSNSRHLKCLKYSVIYNFCKLSSIK